MGCGASVPASNAYALDTTANLKEATHDGEATAPTCDIPDVSDAVITSNAAAARKSLAVNGFGRRHLFDDTVDWDDPTPCAQQTTKITPLSGTEVAGKPIDLDTNSAPDAFVITPCTAVPIHELAEEGASPARKMQEEYDTRGVSVLHLQTSFLEHVERDGPYLRHRCTDRGGTHCGEVTCARGSTQVHGAEATIYEIESKVILTQSVQVCCPRDCDMGSAYVDAIPPDAVGRAQFVLSYSWSSSIGEIIKALVAYCERCELNPTNTYVWLCCLCTNRHRVHSRKSSAHTATQLRTQIIERMSSIGHVLSLLGSWRQSANLKRTWCLWEIWHASRRSHTRATHTSDVSFDFIMSPSQQLSFQKMLLSDFDLVNDSLICVDFAASRASEAADEQSLRRVVQQADDADGFGNVNKSVRLALKRWLIRESHALLDSIVQADYCTATGLMDGLARLLQRSHRYLDALPLLELALRTREEHLGVDHPDTGVIARNLAVLHGLMSNPSQALLLSQRAVRIQEAELGKHPPDVAKRLGLGLGLAKSLNELAVLQRSLGNHSEVAALYQRSLEILDHPVVGSTCGRDSQAIVGSTCSGLASVLHQSLGKPDEALPLHQRALAIRIKELGPSHLDTAFSLGNVAVLYQTMGKNSEALPLYQQALSIREKTLGPEHERTASSLNKLAGLHRSMGQPSVALPLYQRALIVRTKVLGSNHPDTVCTLSSLAMLHEAMGQPELAIPMCQQALDIREKVLGSEHPDTARSLNDLALLHTAMGQQNLSLPLCERALKIREKKLGLEHADTATSLNDLALLYKSMEMYSKALPLGQRALSVRQSQLGSQHPDTAESLDTLASLHRAMGDNSSALLLYQQALMVYEVTLGPDHPHTATSINNLASLRKALGQYAEALPLYERALEIRAGSLGTEHPATLHCADNAASLRERLNQNVKKMINVGRMFGKGFGK